MAVALCADSICLQREKDGWLKAHELGTPES